MNPTTEASYRVKIDTLLKDAGCDLTDGVSLQFAHALADGSRTDYARRDRSGRSRAAVEAKRASINPIRRRISDATTSSNSARPSCSCGTRHGAEPLTALSSVGGRHMSDIFDKRRRSELMARIRARDTAPELSVRRIAHRMGLRFRLHRKDLPGCPDLVLPKHRLVVFVHGCFWHRHRGCSRASTPKSRVRFWTEKLAANVARDRRTEAAVRALGWRVLVIWECETRHTVALQHRLAAVTTRGGSAAESESTVSPVGTEHI